MLASPLIQQRLVFHEPFYTRSTVLAKRGAVATEDGTLFSVPHQIITDASNYITYPAHQWPLLGATQVSVWFRVVVSGIGGLIRVFGSEHSSGAGYEWRTELSAGQLRFVVPVGGTARNGDLFTGTIGQELTAGLVATYNSGADETTLTTYADGVLVGAVGPYSGRVIDPDDSWQIGRYKGSQLNGIVRDFRMYVQALDALDIADIEAEGA